MAASTGDKITDIRNAARPNSARATGTRSAGGTSLACDNLAGWPTASKVHFVTYQLNSSSAQVAGTQLDCTGIVSGNTIGSITVVDGTDTGNSVNDVVEMIPTAAWGQDLADALTNQHSRTGTHTVITATSLATTGNSSIGGNETVTGNETITGNLAVTGTTTLTGATAITAPYNPYKFSVGLTNAQNVTVANTKILLNSKSFDTSSNFDATTNFRFTAPITGFYHFTGKAEITSDITGLVCLFKNGVEAARGNTNNSATNTSHGSLVSKLLSLSASDYVELYWCFSSGTFGLNPTAVVTYLEGFFVSAT